MKILKNKWFGLVILVLHVISLVWMNIDLCKLSSVSIAWNISVISLSVHSFFTSVDICLDNFIEDKDSN